MNEKDYMNQINKMRAQFSIATISLVSAVKPNFVASRMAAMHLVKNDLNHPLIKACEAVVESMDKFVNECEKVVLTSFEEEHDGSSEQNAESKAEEKPEEKKEGEE